MKGRKTNGTDRSHRTRLTVPCEEQDSEYNRRFRLYADAYCVTTVSKLDFHLNDKFYVKKNCQIFFHHN